VISTKFFFLFITKKIFFLFSRIRNLDRNYFKRWLLRETPQERMDIKLLQTFKKINTQAAMKVHDTAKGLVPAAASSTLTTSLSANNLRSDRKVGNVSELLAAKLINSILKSNFYLFSFCYSLPEHTVPDLMFFQNNAAEHHHDDAQMHHFLDTNLHRAKPRVRELKYFIKL